MKARCDRMFLAGLALSIALPLSVGALPAPEEVPVPDEVPLPPIAPSSYDVSGDGLVSPIDILLIVNYYNNPVHGLTVPPAPPQYDVNGDGVISPIDVLILINWINAHGITPAYIPIPEPPLPPDIA